MATPLAALALALAIQAPAAAAPTAHAATGCRVESPWRLAPARVVKLSVQGTTCLQGKQFTGDYQRCLRRDRAWNGRCYGHATYRCLRPEFLGGCGQRERLLSRRVAGFRCVELRLYQVRDRYEGRVDCRDGGRRISHDYTLFTGAPVAVGRESELRAAWANPHLTAIDLTRDILLRACRIGDPIRESTRPMTLDGHDHTIRQACFEKRLLRQDGTGFLLLKNVTLTRGGSDGPGAAVTTRGEIKVVDSKVQQNLAEEPGGGIFSQRKVTIVRSVITGNLANDDGGGVYARRGGVRVFDSIISNNLVDGSGGAIGSTGDIVVARSHIDGNTTDGDGGAIYADEQGDVTVVDSTVDGSTADGPGGAIFTLDGDVTVVNSTLTGNRADDRGGAISGEADVLIVNSTIARNAAVAHVGGGVWARGDLYVANSTISDNYAEGEGGGVLAAGVVDLVYATVIDNVAPVAANVGAGERLEAFGSVIGPAKTDFSGAQIQPTETSCRVSTGRSFGYNVVSDRSCKLAGQRDVVDGGLPLLGPLAASGGSGEVHLPAPGSPALDSIPIGDCTFASFREVLESHHRLAGLVSDLVVLTRGDQRGVARPQGTGCDAGAAEVER